LPLRPLRSRQIRTTPSLGARAEAGGRTRMGGWTRPDSVEYTRCELLTAGSVSGAPGGPARELRSREAPPRQGTGTAGVTVIVSFPSSQLLSSSVSATSSL
jgi:hypothetical protein